jgi:hypothetical protein
VVDAYQVARIEGRVSRCSQPPVPRMTAITGSLPCVQPFSTHREHKICEAGQVSARARHAVHQTTSQRIGGQVCEKWLRDRKDRKLSSDDIAHYEKLVGALVETIRLMKEIDEVIEAHGGWPGAFQSIEAADTASRGVEAATPAH